jgi:hypothetical protein
MVTKVETSAFSSGASVDDMLRQAEDLFAARFGMFPQFSVNRYQLINQREVIRNGQWLDCVPLLVTEVIILALLDQVLR